jgi:hypothetical protein
VRHQCSWEFAGRRAIPESFADRIAGSGVRNVPAGLEAVTNSS